LRLKIDKDKTNNYTKAYEKTLKNNLNWLFKKITNVGDAPD
jgi:hypothetical protein